MRPSNNGRVVKGTFMQASTADTVQHGSTRTRRRTYLIDGAFQWKYALMLAIGVFLVASLLGLSLFGILHHQARMRVINPGTPDLWSNTRIIGVFALGFSVLVVAAMTAWGILLTHRISGPARVLENRLNELANGRVPPRRPLRKRDEFKALHAAFWRATDALRAKKQGELAALGEALNTARLASKDNDEHHDEAMQSIVAQLETLREQMAAALGVEVYSVAPDLDEEAVRGRSPALEPVASSV